MNRRGFLRSSILVPWAGSAVFTADPPPPPDAVAEIGFRRRVPIPLTSEPRRRLDQALSTPHAEYDPAERMLRRSIGGKYDYNTHLRNTTAHPTRDSTAYAVALLDTGDPPMVERAIAVLRRIVALQDADPASANYGVWPHYMEEPLDKAPYVDRNWADFIGVQLLQVLLDHPRRLPGDLLQSVRESVRHATVSIRRRNMGPGYTNIAVMDIYVNLVAGAVLGDADLEQDGLARLTRFQKHTQDNGGSFSEYNSPTYTLVTLAELARLRNDVVNRKARPAIAELYRAAWEEIARHFHAPSQQWSGPHSRSYSNLLDAGKLNVIERGLGGTVNWGAATASPSLDEHRVFLACPEDLRDNFLRLTASREVRQIFESGPKPLIGTTWLHRSFSLGTVNRQDLWNQRRNLLAYWGTAEQPGYLHLRFLHDGYDFTSARFYSQQSQGQVLAGINFATDSGDRHPSLDRVKNATIRARTLRLRFELGGAGSQVALPGLPARVADPIRIKLGDLRLELRVPFARFGDWTGRWSTGKEAGIAFVDVVFLAGEEREIQLAAIGLAAIGFALALSEGEPDLPEVRWQQAEDRLALEWSGLQVTVSTRPGPVRELNAAAALAYLAP